LAANLWSLTLLRRHDGSSSEYVVKQHTAESFFNLKSYRNKTHFTFLQIGVYKSSKCFRSRVDGVLQVSLHNLTCLDVYLQHICARHETRNAPSSRQTRTRPSPETRSSPGTIPSWTKASWPPPSFLSKTSSHGTSASNSVYEVLQ
ncbi:unnamed protein product, partial [Cylicocyclus nassatus]